MSLKRGLLYTLLTQAPTLVLFFVGSMLMTRLLGDTGRGEYALITNNAILLTMLLSLNLGFGITYFASRTDAEARNGVSSAIIVLLINVVIVPFLLLGLHTVPQSAGVLLPDGRVGWGYLGYLYLNIILGMINSLVSGALLGRKQFKALNGLSLLNAGSSALGFVLLYIARDSILPVDRFPAVLWVAAAMLSLQTVVGLGLYTRLVSIPPVPDFRWSIVKPVLAFTLLGHASNLVNLINYRFDVWVVDHYHGAAQLGLYAVAVGLAQLLFQIPEPLSRVVQPFLYAQEKDELMARFKLVARINFTTVLLLGVALGLIAHWLLPLLFGEVFAASAWPLRLILPGILFSAAAKLLATLVVQGGFQRFNLYATIVGAVLTIGLDLLLIPRWGIAGAAVASSISYAAVLCVVLLTIKFRLGYGIRDLFLVGANDLKTLRGLLPKG